MTNAVCVDKVNMQCSPNAGGESPSPQLNTVNQILHHLLRHVATNLRSTLEQCVVCEPSPHARLRRAHALLQMHESGELPAYLLQCDYAPQEIFDLYAVPRVRRGRRHTAQFAAAATDCPAYTSAVPLPRNALRCIRQAQALHIYTSSVPLPADAQQRICEAVARSSLQPRPSVRAACHNQSQPTAPRLQQAPTERPGSDDLTDDLPRDFMFDSVPFSIEAQDLLNWLHT